MVLSSVLNQGSRLFRSPTVVGAAVSRGGLRSTQQAQHCCQFRGTSGPTLRVAAAVHHRSFWDWRGAGKGSDQGGDQGSAKGAGAGSGSSKGVGGKGGPGGSTNGAGGTAAEDQPPSAAGGGGAAGSSPMIVGAGDQAPRPSRLIGLPIKWRPLFPTTAYTYTITNPDVLTAVAKSSQGGFPYVAVFLRKEPEWNQGRSEGGSGGGSGGSGGGGGGGNGAQTDGAVENAEGVIEGGVENAVQQTYPEVITSLDEIHEVGTLAQVADIRPSAMSGEVQLLLVGHRRLNIKEVVSMGPPLEVEVEHWNTGEFDADSEVIRAYCQEILSTVQEVVVLNPLLRERITFFSERNINVHNPFKLADLAATLSSGSPDKLQAVLAEKSAEGRLRLALDIISKVN
ncbi:unnamed protein product [Laminaria digitata]